MARISINTHRYEFGDATVFVKSSTTNKLLDGLIRGAFTCEVHPVGAPVWTCRIAAFFPWDAANRALAAWEAERLEGLA